VSVGQIRSVFSICKMRIAILLNVSF